MKIRILTVKYYKKNKLTVFLCYSYYCLGDNLESFLLLKTEVMKEIKSENEKDIKNMESRE